MKTLTRSFLGFALALGLAFAGSMPSVVAFNSSASRAAQRRTAQRRTAQRTNNFLIPNNTLVEARLNRRLQAQTARQGERFTMTVTSPNQYRGAIIEGSVSQSRRSGRVRGRSEVTLVFNRIRYGGRTYNFAGTIESALTPNGGRIDVDNEGSVREESQTNRTVTRTAIGAGVGAIIGGIAGGGSGAAIGAGVGGGAGAGSVLVQGRRNLDLLQGTRLTIRSGAPQ